MILTFIFSTSHLASRRMGVCFHLLSKEMLIYLDLALTGVSVASEHSTITAANMVPSTYKAITPYISCTQSLKETLIVQWL